MANVFHPNEKKARLAVLKKLAGNDDYIKPIQPETLIKPLKDKERKELKGPKFYK